MIDRVARIWLIVLGSAGLLSASAFAQSGLHNPEAPLLVLPDGESPALLAAADRLYREAQKSVSELEASGLNAEKIGKANVTAVRLQRLAERLKNRHEAAGFDYALRAGDFQQRLLAMAGQAKKVAGFTTSNSAQRLAALRDAGLPRIPGWTKQAVEQPEQVEQELFALLDAMQEHLIWLEASGASQYVVPFHDLAEAVRGRRAASDKQAVEAELDQQLAQRPPDGEPFLASLRGAAQEIQQHGQAAWQGQMLRGEQLLPAAYQHWQQLQIEFARRRALLWARRGASHEHTWELKDVEAAQRSLDDQMPAALAAIVSADAQRTSVTDAEAVYQQRPGEAP